MGIQNPEAAADLSHSQAETTPNDVSGAQQSEEAQMDRSDIMATLANINQRLNKLDKLDEISSALAGEFKAVQSQVGEVANKVGTVKSDLNRCEEKWEKNTSAMMDRIDKVEKGFQAFEQKWEANNSDILKDISSINSGMDRQSSRVDKLEEELAKHKENWESLQSLERQIKVSANNKFSEIKDLVVEEVRKELSQERQASERERDYETLKGKAFNKRHNLVVFGLPESSSQEDDLKLVTTFFSTRMGLP